MTKKDTSLSDLFEVEDPRDASLARLERATEDEDARPVETDAEAWAVDLYRPLSAEEKARMRPSPEASSSPPASVIALGDRRRRLAASGAFAAAAAAAVWLMAVGPRAHGPASLSLVTSAPGVARDVEVVSVRLQTSTKRDEATLYVLDPESARLRPSAAMLSRGEGAEFSTEARAGRLTGGYFGALELVAVAGGPECGRLTTLKEARAACEVAVTDLTVAPPPIDVRVDVVRHDILGAAEPDAGAILVPTAGRLRLRLTARANPVRGRVAHHVWTKDLGSADPGPWRRLTEPNGLNARDERGLEVEAERLLRSAEGLLLIKSGPADVTAPDPTHADSPAWTTTRVRLVRVSPRGE